MRSTQFILYYHRFDEEECLWKDWNDKSSVAIPIIHKLWIIIVSLLFGFCCFFFLLFAFDFFVLNQETVYGQVRWNKIFWFLNYMWWSLHQACSGIASVMLPERIDWRTSQRITNQCDTLRKCLAPFLLLIRFYWVQLTPNIDWGENITKQGDSESQYERRKHVCDLHIQFVHWV